MTMGWLTVVVVVVECGPPVVAWASWPMGEELVVVIVCGPWVVVVVVVVGVAEAIGDANGGLCARS